MKSEEKQATVLDVKGLNAGFLCEVQTAIDSIKAHPIFKEVHTKAPNAQSSSGFMQVRFACHVNSQFNVPHLEMCIAWFESVLVHCVICFGWREIMLVCVMETACCHSQIMSCLLYNLSTRRPSTKLSSRPPCSTQASTGAQQIFGGWTRIGHHRQASHTIPHQSRRC